MRPLLNMPSLNEIILQLDVLAGSSMTLLALGPDDLDGAFD